MSVRRRILWEEDDAAVWLIDAPIMTNCGAAESSEMRGLQIALDPEALKVIPEPSGGERRFRGNVRLAI
jgi:hypothetical protein